MEKKGKWWHVLARAMAVGGTMTVPGASGGTMAMILGIYEELIESMGSLPGLLAECIRCGNDGCARRRLWDCLRFLALFSLGALAGMALLAKGVLSLLERYPMAVSYFFLGAVAGGIPLICRQAQVKKITWQALFWPLAGLLMVYGLAALPEGLFTAGLPGAASSPGVPSFRALLFQFLGGCILAVALILPGISVSQMLLMLGLYEPVMEAVSSLRFASAGTGSRTLHAAGNPAAGQRHAAPPPAHLSADPGLCAGLPGGTVSRPAGGMESALRPPGRRGRLSATLPPVPPGRMRNYSALSINAFSNSG